METIFDKSNFDGLDKALSNKYKLKVYTSKFDFTTGILTKKEMNKEIIVVDENILGILESLSARYCNEEYLAPSDYEPTYLNIWIFKGNILKIDKNNEKYQIILCSPDEKIFHMVKSNSLCEGLNLIEDYLEYIDIEDISEILKGNINYNYEGEEDRFLLKRIKK